MGLEQTIHLSIGPGLKELDSVWDYIGYDDDQRGSKLQGLADTFQRCLCDYIAVENQHRVELDTRVESLKRKAAQVCQSLRLPAYFPPRGLPSLQLLRHLEEHIAQYEVEIVARQGKFSQMSVDIGELCEQLGLDKNVELRDMPDSGPRPDEFIPTEQDLDKMAKKLEQLQSRRDELLKHFVGFCGDIKRIAADIEYLPESDLEAAVLRLPPPSSKQLPGAPSGWQLTDSSLAELQSWRLRLVKHKAMLVGTCDELRNQVALLWRRLRLNPADGEAFLQKHRGYRPRDLTALREELARCQELRRGRLATVYRQGLCEEAVELATQCFEDELNGIADADLDELERSVDRLRERYEQSRELYDTVRLYQQTWDAYMEVEQRMKDPTIFSNRGGILLKTEKEKKLLIKELPKVEARVAEQLRACPGGEGFVIRGLTFQQYVQRLWDDFRGEKEAAKVNRRMSRGGSLSASSATGASASSQDLSVSLHAASAAGSVASRKSLAPGAAAVYAAAGFGKR